MTVGERNKMVTQNLGLIPKAISTLKTSQLPDGIEIDDLYQAGAMGLMRAAESFNPRKCSVFAKFGFVKVLCAIKELIRGKSRNQKHTKLITNSWYPEGLDSFPHSDGDVASEMRSKEALSSLNLNNREQEIVKLLLQNYTPSEMGKLLNISADWVRQVIRTRIRPMAKKAIERGDL